MEILQKNPLDIYYNKNLKKNKFWTYTLFKLRNVLGGDQFLSGNTHLSLLLSQLSVYLHPAV